MNESSEAMKSEKRQLKIIGADHFIEQESELRRSEIGRELEKQDVKIADQHTYIQELEELV